MKHLPSLVVLSTAILFASFSSCKGKKEAAAPASAPSTTQAAPPPAPAPVADPSPKAGGKARYIVSFYSTGGGIDLKTHDEFVNLMNTWNKKITYTPIRKGREGETTYCLGLNELTASEQEEFIFRAGKILSYNVHFKENAATTRKTTAPTDEKFRLVVSFYSIGEGINMPLVEKFNAFIAAYSPKVKAEKYSWGREGETDYCFRLNELNADQQADFVQKAKDILVKKVNIKENDACPE